jgi:hypothetical protein
MGADESAGRRGVVPQAAGRSLWLAAAWTGAGAALVGAIIAIGAVAVCWLPASGGSGTAGSAIRAGVLTFLAALHGGVTVDGLPSDFVPLGMTVVVALLAWRAGSALADAAQLLGSAAPARLGQALAVQAAVFAGVCGIAARLAPLGTSNVSAVAAALAGLILFGCAGGTAFVRATPLRDLVSARVPSWSGTAVRGAAVGVAVYLGAGALLVAGSLVLHHDRVETLSRHLGGGWSGVPVLLLGLLAAPNAAIAGASYLAGPGFALGSGTAVSLGSTAHGTLPDFPILGAVPSGPATTPVWLLVGCTPFVAGVCVARAVAGAESLLLRLRIAGAAAGLAGFAGLLLAWQGGGAIGSGQLRVVGASPWQFGLATGAPLAVVAALALSARAALAWWRARSTRTPKVEDEVDEVDEDEFPTVVLAAVAPSAEDEVPRPEEGDALAG